MPTITKLSSTKRQDAVNLCIEEQFITTITIDTILHFNLKKGLSITPQKLEKIIIYSFTQKLLSQSLNYIGVRLRSTKEVKDYLSQKIYKLILTKIHSDLFISIVEKNKDSLINGTIDKLLETKYLDDSKFAKAWVESRVNSKPRGKKLLQLELIKKGIDQQIIDHIINDNEIISDQKNTEMLVQMLAKANRSIQYKKYPIEKAKQVLIRRMLSKGFTYQDIVKKIDELVINEYNDNNKTE